jgi:CRISPR-associated endonuclease Cas1 subtype II
LRSQISWDKESKGAVWTEIVKEKISQQRDLLKRLGHTSEAQMLSGYIEEMGFADNTNREGHAAKVYFNALFGKDFSRDTDCPINACLNYGYAIMLSSVNREITASGYFTQLGIFHDNMFNPFNLGSDLMEPFRPVIDETVVGMMPEELNTENKKMLLNILNREVMIDEKRNFLNNAIRIYCRSVLDAIIENNTDLLRFCTYEI